MSWEEVLKIDTEDAIRDAKRFGNIDDEFNTPNPEMVKIVRFISDFGKKHNLKGFENLESEAEYGSTTDGKNAWRNMDKSESPPSIFFRDSALNDIINTSASSRSVFEMKEKIRNAVNDKFGGRLYTDEGWNLVTYR